jgi:hypothetical protein
MILLRKFNKKEILEAVVKIACESLPEDSSGVVDAKYKNGSIEVYYIQEQESSNIPS